MQNPAHNIITRIAVSLDKEHDALLLKIQTRLSIRDNKRFTVAEIVRLALRTLDKSI